MAGGNFGDESSDDERTTEMSKLEKDFATKFKGLIAEANVIIDWLEKCPINSSI
jgi:hypothetical protein